MAKEYNSLAHTKHYARYHIVFTPKCRRKAIYAELRSDIRDILKRLCSYKGIEIIEGAYDGGPRAYACGDTA